MKTQPISQNNPNFGKLHAPKLLWLGSGIGVSREKLLENPAIKACAEKFDVYVEPLRRDYYNTFVYGLRGVKRGNKKDIVTPEHEFRGFSRLEGIELVGNIVTQLREILMRVTAEKYPVSGVFKSRDILNILETDEIKDVFKPEEAFRYSIEQSGKSTLLTKFFEINPADDNVKDYDKVLSIMKSNPNINFNQKDNLDISVLENILNFENAKGLDLVLYTEFDYSPELDRLFHNIQNEDFKKKALGVKIKFPSVSNIDKQGFSPESLAFLDSPFCDSKNTAVSIWLKSLRYGFNNDEQKRIFNILYKYLPEYYQNHYQREMGSLSGCFRRYGEKPKQFFAPSHLVLHDKTIPSEDLLRNISVWDCAHQYSVVIERGVQNGSSKKKVARFLPFLPPKIVEEPRYEYILKGMKKGKENIETQEHSILTSDGIFYMGNLVEEIRKKDRARFIEMVSRKHPDTRTFTAKELLELLESDDIKGNYTRQEAFENKINSRTQATLLTKFFEIKKTKENQNDYEKLVSIIKETPNLDLLSMLPKVFELENSGALDLFTDMEIKHSKEIDRLYYNIADEDFKKKVQSLKIQFPDAVSLLKKSSYTYSQLKNILSYLDSPFCNSRKEAIRIWSEIKTEFDSDKSCEINAMLYKYLPENLRLDL